MPCVQEMQYVQLMCNALGQNFLSAASQGFVIGLIPPRNFVEQGQCLPKPVFTIDATACFDNQNDITEKNDWVDALTQEVQQLWNQTLHNPNKACFLHAVNADFASNTVVHPYRWEKLLFDLARHFKIIDTENFVRQGAFCLDGFEMLLSYCEERPSHIDLQIDMGCVPASLPQELVYQALLSYNEQTSLQSKLVWGLNPRNGHVVVSVDHCVWLQKEGFKAMTAHDMEILFKTKAHAAQSIWQATIDQTSQVSDFYAQQIRAQQNPSVHF